MKSNNFTASCGEQKGNEIFTRKRWPFSASKSSPCLQGDFKDARRGIRSNSSLQRSERASQRLLAFVSLSSTRPIRKKRLPPGRLVEMKSTGVVCGLTEAKNRTAAGIMGRNDRPAKRCLSVRIPCLVSRTFGETTNTMVMATSIRLSLEMVPGIRYYHVHL